MRKIQNIALLLLFMGAIVVGCNKDDDDAPCHDETNPECPNYDPCWDIEEPTAQIIMQESINALGEVRWPGNDSIFLNTVRFSSPHQGDEFVHTWYLGAEVINDAVFSRSHETIPPPSRPAFITVSHVIEFPVDSTCYTNLTGRDSTSRTYRLIRYYNEYHTLGRFRGVFVNETDSFDFRISAVNQDGSDAQIYANNITIIAVNFHNEGDSVSGFTYSGRNSLGIFTGQGFGTPRGFMTPEGPPGHYKLEYRYGFEDFTVMARKIE